MLNLKIVYQQKIHKLPSRVVSYQEIIDTVKKLYPNLSQFYLFTIIPQFEEIEEINCEFSFSFLKKIYKKEGLNTIKFLVLQDKNLNNLNPESLNLLNQSSLNAITSGVEYNQVQIEKSNKTIHLGTKQKVEYEKDEALKETVQDILDKRLKEYGLIQKKKIIITEQEIPEFYFEEKKQLNNVGSNNEYTFF